MHIFSINVQALSVFCSLPQLSRLAYILFGLELPGNREEASIVGPEKESTNVSKFLLAKLKLISKNPTLHGLNPLHISQNRMWSEIQYA